MGFNELISPAVRLLYNTFLADGELDKIMIYAYNEGFIDEPKLKEYQSGNNTEQNSLIAIQAVSSNTRKFAKPVSPYTQPPEVTKKIKKWLKKD